MFQFIGTLYETLIPSVTNAHDPVSDPVAPLWRLPVPGNRTISFQTMRNIQCGLRELNGPVEERALSSR